MDFVSDLLQPEVIWFAAGFILLIVELGAPGLIIGFAGVGAWIVAIVLLIFPDISIATQLIIFIISSVLLLILLRRSLQKVFGLNTITNQSQQIDDEFIGHTAIVTKKIGPKNTGKVEFKGAEWQASSDTEIEKGSEVKIIDRESIKFIVKLK